MKSTSFLFLVAATALMVVLLMPLASASSNTADPFRRRDREATFGDTTREQILETRERRKRHLKNMILDARKKLADHSAGEITLTAEKKQQLENQMDIFQRKLDTMQHDLEEWVSVDGD
jgi:hypothetical protein